MFDDLRLYFEFRKARGAIQKELSMPNGKAILLNGLKHFLMSAGAIAGASLVGWLSNDAALLQLLTNSGIPGFVAIALVPLAHSIIAMIQKKYLPGQPPAPPAQ